MPVKWRTSCHNDTLIERIDCARESGSHIWIYAFAFNGKRIERKIRKDTKECVYHDSYMKAYTHLNDRLESRISEARAAVVSSIVALDILKENKANRHE